MNYGLIVKILGKIMVTLGLFMSTSLIFCVAYQENLINYLAFAIPSGITIILGLILNNIKPQTNKIGIKEGSIIAGLTWIVSALFGCMPLLISGSLPNFFDAFFEIVSGFTTTGASVCTDVEGLAHSIKFWRSFTHWIGGMGILVFVLAFIPESKDGSAVHILRAESPGPQVGRLVSRMQASSRILYLIYIVMTLILILLLWLGPDTKMNFFNSLIYSLGTAGTGGFAIHSTGLEFFLPYTQYVIAIFMLLFGVNFTLYYLILIGNIKTTLMNEELRWYIAIVVIAVTIITINIFSIYQNFEYSFRQALFQVASIISTTGYSSIDFNLWPSLSKTVIIILMVSGAMAGSTAGGVKVTRINLLTKSSVIKVKNIMSPRKVEVLTQDGKPISSKTIESIQSFFIIYIIVFIICTLLISIDNFSIETNITASLSCISNIGPGLGEVGPYGSFAGYSNFSKFILSIEMIAGRLELFPLLTLFSPKTWKRNV